MLDRIVTWSLEYRFFVIFGCLLFALWGITSIRDLSLDAFPDTTPVQVQINTTAPSLSPMEMEQQVTLLVEQNIAGLPHLKEVRSISKFGLSQVVAIFEDEMNIYLARQLIMERLQTVQLAANIQKPSLGPISTGLGEIYHYIITGNNKSIRELRTFHDWFIKPRLLSIQGITEINTWGGEHKQYHVEVDPNKFKKYNINLHEVTAALEKNNLVVGGGNVAQAGELYLVQGISLTTNISEIEKVVVTSYDGIPIYIKDVANVKEGHEIRRGAVTANGKGEAVLGLAFMIMGENSREVTLRIQQQVKNLESALPEGVQIEVLYQRTDLIDQVIETVKENLFEGALLVIAVLFIFLGNFRAGFIVALVIPLSMLFAVQAMIYFAIAGSLMSLGAIDFGLIVDSSVVMVENNIKRLSENTELDKLDIIRKASLEVRKPTMFGELIIMIVYLPILALEGVEGKLFRPMALTVIFALLGSLILSITLMPVLSSFFLSKKKHKENIFVRFAKWLYRPFLRFAIRFYPIVIILAIVLVILTGLLAAQLGMEFIPRLSEMSIVINTVRLASVDLEESVRYGTQIEKVIKNSFPDEVNQVWTRTGTAEVATDPMGIELSDVFITLTPKNKWKKAQTQQELVTAIGRELEGLPGMRTIFTQPIEMRVNEMVAGIRSDLGIKIFGDDFTILKSKAKEVESILETIPGNSDIYSEQITGQPILEIKIKQEAISRYGVAARDILEIIEIIGGRKVAEIREEQKRFDLVVKLSPEYTKNLEQIRNILVPTSNKQYFPLYYFADVREIEGNSTITREWQKRRMVVQCNVRNRDIASFVKEVQQKLQKEISFPVGYYIVYGGQFEHLQRANTRLMIIVPIALALILILLYLSTQSILSTLIIFTGAPFAALGGVIALWYRDIPFTISAGVGFIAVSGVAMLNGLIISSTMQTFLKEGVESKEAIYKSCMTRLRPILMTALVAGLGFLPMAFNTGVGAEVQRPLATVVIGGVISDNLLTLLVLPALYSLTMKTTKK